MNQEKPMSECDLCHKQVEEATTLSCQHNFCGSCLTDDDKICNAESCPTCSEKCKEGKKKHVDSSFNLCGYCEKEEGGWFCEECDQSWCSTCLEVHTKMKLSKKHRVVAIKLKELKLETIERVYCIDCKHVFDKKFLVSHKNHKTETETEFIKEKVAGWKDEINKIRAYEVLKKSHMRECENKLKDKRREILNNKDRVRNNFKELLEGLKEKESREYERIDTDLSRIQKEFLEYQRKIEKEILSLQEIKSNIEIKLKEINNGLHDDFKNDFPIKQPQINPHPTFEPHFSFQPIPIEVLKNLQPCIVPTEKYCIGKYEAEENKLLSMSNVGYFFQMDNKYIYSRSSECKKIHIYSLETLQLIKTLPKPYNINSYYLYIINVEERFYFIGKVHNFNKILTINEIGVKLHYFTLPSNIFNFSKSEAGKVFIECDKHVILYDAVTYKQESIIDDVVRPRFCCSLGGDEYCMEVVFEGEYKLVKVVNGGIVKVVDNSVYRVSSNSLGIVCSVDNNDKTKMQVMDRNLDVILKFEINYSEHIRDMNIDDAGNIHILNVIIKSLHNRFYLKKYKMIPK